jgi:fatty-acyl-CoA synthase
MWKRPEDEWQAISLSYTSGTTGNPKGVVYHHRGSYLMATGSAVAWNMPNRLNFLTIVPMFHCNGWCYPWTVPMLNGRTICLRNIDVKKIFELIDKYNVTHFGGAPIVLNMITGAPESDRKKLKHKVHVLTAGAPPPSIIFKKMKELGFEVMHVYGLTETYGHVTQCAWNNDWNEFDEDKQNEIKARQGVRYPNLEGATIMDPETMQEVPRDGKTIGEIMLRGNVVMKGYFKDKAATDKAMAGGWFHSGDLAVMHPDGYVKIQDRSKDIIISGGENISSIEIENTLSKHPSVSIAAVVAKPDEKWGEVPCAFIEMVKDKPTTEKELISFCKETLAGFKVPKQVVFCELPKTSTGKIQKFELRKKF